MRVYGYMRCGTYALNLEGGYRVILPAWVGLTLKREPIGDVLTVLNAGFGVGPFLTYGSTNSPAVTLQRQDIRISLGSQTSITYHKGQHTVDRQIRRCAQLILMFCELRCYWCSWNRVAYGDFVDEWWPCSTSREYMAVQSIYEWYTTLNQRINLQNGLWRLSRRCAPASSSPCMKYTLVCFQRTTTPAHMCSWWCRMFFFGSRDTT